MNRPLSEKSPGRWVSPAKATADLLALSSPLLILLALGAMVYRSPPARLQALPALLIGCGLLLFSWLRRRRRRSMVLRLLREPGQGARDLPGRDSK
jgi:hypothetical protein